VCRHRFADQLGAVDSGPHGLVTAPVTLARILVTHADAVSAGSQSSIHPDGWCGDLLTVGIVGSHGAPLADLEVGSPVLYRRTKGPQIDNLVPILKTPRWVGPPE
jgi:hypothetical protein